MEVIMTRGELKEAVTGLAKVAGSRPLLPVLGCARFEVADGHATAEATDLEQTVRYGFSGTGNQGSGAFTVPLARLRELARGNRHDQVRLRAGADGTLTLSSHVDGHEIGFPVSAPPVSEWPGVPSPVTTRPAPGFLASYRRLTPFVSRESGRALSGVYIDTGGSGDKPVSMVGCDGRRLTVLNSMRLPLEAPLIVPVTSFLASARLPEEVNIGTGESQGTTVLALEAGPWRYTAGVIHDAYPNYRQVIPVEEPGARAFVFSDADAGVLGRILPGMPGGECVFLEGRDGRVTLHAREAGSEGWTAVTLETSHHEGPGGCTALNRHYLLDALGAGFRQFNGGSGDEAAPLLSVDGQGGLHVLMPMSCGKGDYPPLPDFTAADATVQDGDALPSEAVAVQDVKAMPSEATAAQDEVKPAAEAGSGCPTWQKPRKPKPTQEITPEITQKITQEATTMEVQSMKEQTAHVSGTRPALEQALAAAEAVKGQLAEIQTAVAGLTRTVRAALKEGRSQAGDLDKARNALQRLQAISL